VEAKEKEESRRDVRGGDSTLKVENDGKNRPLSSIKYTYITSVH
jgi:hypothetical protein